MPSNVTEIPIIDFFEVVLGVTNLSPIQKITLKAIRGEELDTTTPIPCTHAYQTENFLNEVEMFKFFSGKTSYVRCHYSDASLCYGRRGGKCHTASTEILTPQGPIAIKDIKPGDLVYGYNRDGSITPTPVLEVHENGIKEVFELVNSNKVLAAASADHRWLTSTYNSNKFKKDPEEKAIKDFVEKDQYIERRFVKIPCGNVNEPNAYVIGALLGNGCCRQGSSSRLDISCPSDLVPLKISKILKAERVKLNSIHNFTYSIYRPDIEFELYKNWCKDRYSYEKITDLEIVKTWDRESCLAFMAGLLDTDGSVHMSPDTQSINVQFGCQSKTTVEAFQYLFYKLWQHKLTLRVDNRDKYKNGPVYYVSCKSNLYAKMALYELDPHLVTPSKKWKQEYEALPEQRSDQRIGVKLGKSYRAETYDITIGNDTNLYLLANEGLITHNSTTIGAGLAIYYATQFDYIPYLGTSPHATIPIVSPTKEQAGEVFASIKNFFLRSPWLFQKFLDGKVDAIQTEYSEEDMKNPSSISGGQIKLNNKVIIKVMAADISKIRGMAVPFAILDEVNFAGVEGNDAKTTDKGLYEALAPALSQFQTIEGMALVLKISSPNGQAGLMFNDYLKRLEEGILHLQVPTWYANPSISVKYLEKQKKKGINYFNREYGAEYTASETSYLDPNLIEKAIIKGTQKLEHEKGYIYGAMTDFATRNDLWAFAIGHKEYILDVESKQKVEKVKIDLLMHWRGTDGNELDPAEVIPEICMYLKEYRVPYCVSDQYAFSALKGLFAKEGCLLKEFTLSNTSKIKMFYSLQISLNTQSLQIVNNPIAIQHLKDLREKRSHISNKIQISAANNSHDDYAIVIAGVVYQFDKSSPLYIGYHQEEEDEGPSTKDDLGRQLLTPTAQDLADYVGVSQFYDNRKEEKKDEDPNDDGSDFWFSI